MNRYEALTLNRLLPRLNVGAGALPRESRVKMIDLRNRLNALLREAETYRDDTLRHCADDPEGEKLAQEALHAYLSQPVETPLPALSPDETERIADANPLRMDEYELLCLLTDKA